MKKTWQVSLFLILLCGAMSDAEAQSVVINEALSSNSSFDYDDFFQYEDWIELYNDGGILNLSGYYLSDDPDTLDKWMFPSTNPGLTTILPGGHLRIWCDDDEQQGEDHTNFKLSSEGETVFLVEPDGITIMDSITIGLAQTDISYGRSCDGCSDWQFFNVPTPNAPNADIPLPVSTLFINEYQAANTSTLFDEAFNYHGWVEIFNPNDYQVNMSGYVLELGGVEHTFDNNEPWKTTIDGNDFQIFWLDGDLEMGSNHLGIMPGFTGPLNLYGNDGSLVDFVDFDSSTPENVSQGRSTDGSPLWTTFSIPTPRVTNALQIIQPAELVINEVQSDNFISYTDNAGEYEDWVELHNPTNSPIDIAGYFVTDRLDRPQKWQVPVTPNDSTVIPPGGFVVLFADENGSEGWNHMNFKLSSLGEPLALRSPDGFTVADSVFVPALGQDRSWGREFDAHPNWTTFFIPTPNASNGVNTVEDMGNQTPHMLYPNPSSGTTPVYFSSPAEVYNGMGQPVQSIVRQGSYNLNLPSGHYLVIWSKEINGGREASRLIIH